MSKIVEESLQAIIADQSKRIAALEAEVVRWKDLAHRDATELAAKDADHKDTIERTNTEIARLTALLPVGREMADAIKHNSASSTRAKIAAAQWLRLDTEAPNE